MSKYEVTGQISPPEPFTYGKYPFAKMKVGDSFFVEKMEANNARSSAWHFGKRHGIKFVTRSEKGGLRIWRSA